MNINISSTIINRLIPNNCKELSIGVYMDLKKKYLENEILFCNEKIIISLENLALNLSSHNAEKTYSFDEKKFFRWCEKNDIVVKYERQDCYVVSPLNSFFWQEKTAQKQKLLYSDAVEKHLHLFDMKNRAIYPTRPTDLKRISYADQPFIEHIYVGDSLLLIWDHFNNKSIEPKK